MRFPLADWIDGHAECRYSFGASGMAGVVRPPTPGARELRAASEDELRRRLGALVGVDPIRVFLSPGATEANAWVTWFVARRAGPRVPRCRVALPEYPPLFEGPRSAGFRLVTRPTDRVDLAVVSQPRNPEGDLWSRDRLAEFAERSGATLVDETFREFSRVGSTLRWHLPREWATGSFTKVYGGDDLRVGWVVAPEEDRAEFARFHGIAANELARASVAGALATLDARERLLKVVRTIVDRNRRLWTAATPGGPPLSGPVAFDRTVGPDGDRFARRCLRRSVLVCPGSFFGEKGGVRVGLTRPTFPRDLARYRAVRDAAG
jgi:aspartate/methionine/tyrosine aminotransferase